MRRRFLLLGILFFEGLAFGGDLLEARGLKDGLCYQQLLIVEQKLGRCSIQVWPNTTLQIKIKLDPCVKTIGETTSWHHGLVKIKSAPNTETTARWLRGSQIKSKELQLLLTMKEAGKPQPVSCP